MPATQTTDRRPNRSNEEWDALARDVIVPLLQQGVSMTEIRKGGPTVGEGYGAGVTIRRALARIGYNTKGQKIQVATTKASNAKVLAKRVADRRQAGVAWWQLAMETGKAEDDLKALLAAHGHGDLAAGRVITSRRGKARLAKAQALAEAKAQAEAAKPKRAPRKPRAKKQAVNS